MSDTNFGADKAQQFIDGIKQQASNLPSPDKLKDAAASRLDTVTDKASEAAKNVEEKVASGSDMLDKGIEKAVDTFDNGLAALDKWLSKF